MTDTDPMNRRQQAKAATRAKVIAAARASYLARGYNATTARLLAKQIDMSTGAVFAAFDGGLEQIWTTVTGEPVPGSQPWTPAVTDPDINPDRNALFMCASHCQGGHSEAGAAAAAALGVPFPITMPNMLAKATAEGLDPDHLWPWLREMNPHLFIGAAS